MAAAAATDMRCAQSLLEELHDASLVQSDAGQDGVTRYALLQPVREFAAEGFAATDARAARWRVR